MRFLLFSAGVISVAIGALRALSADNLSVGSMTIRPDHTVDMLFVLCGVVLIVGGAIVMAIEKLHGPQQMQPAMQWQPTTQQWQPPQGGEAPPR